MKQRIGIEYDELFRLIPDQYLVVHNNAPDYTIVDASNSYIELLHLPSHHEIIGQPIVKALPRVDEHSDQGLDSLLRAFESATTFKRSVYTGITRFDTQLDGEVTKRYWETTVYPIVHDETHSVSGFIVATSDVTEKVYENEHLELIKYQHDEMAAFQMIGTWETVVGETSVTADRAMLHLFGIDTRSDNETIEIDDLVTRVHADYRESLRELLTGEVDSAVPHEDEYRIDDERTERWISVRGKRLDTSKKSAKSRCIGVAIDITERKKIEQQATENERELRFMADSMPQLAWTNDADGTMTYFNNKWVEYTGIAIDQLIAGSWADAIHPDDVADVEQTWSNTLESGDMYELEYRLRRGNTKEYEWFIARAMPYTSKSGHVIKWYGTLTNINDNRLAAERLEQRVDERTEQLQQTVAMLKQSNQDLQEFAYVASHDLQEPLRKIQAFGNLLEEDCADKLGDEGKDYLSRMKSAASRMSVLIEDLLTFSRVTSKAQAPREVDLNETIAHVIDDLETRIIDTKGTINVETLLPTVSADPTHMRQLLQNLIGNALKFARPDVPPIVTITSSYDDAHDADVLVVSDNGIGFDDKHAEQIFSVFQRLHGRNEYEGTGIGLAVCRKIVTRYNGTIEAAGTPGRGATFTITLPRPTKGDDA